MAASPAFVPSNQFDLSFVDDFFASPVSDDNSDQLKNINFPSLSLHPTSANCDGLDMPLAYPAAAAMHPTKATSIASIDPAVLQGTGMPPLEDENPVHQQMGVSQDFVALASYIRNGQYTPPDDSPSIPPHAISPLKHDRADEPEPAQNKTKRRRSTVPKSQKRHSVAESVNSVQTEPSPSLKAADAMDHHPPDQTTARRQRTLEKNRVAATRCRRKKKEWTENLEQNLRDLTEERTQLTFHREALKDQLLHLKTLMLQHVNCDCDRIRKYMEQMVAQITAPNTQFVDPSLEASPGLTPDTSSSSASASMSTPSAPTPTSASPF